MNMMEFTVISKQLTGPVYSAIAAFMKDPFLLLCTLLLIVPATFYFLYIKIRKCFPFIVNCWFCNKNTQVSYENTNSFECPNCLQYNGFNSDGSYNKYIPAQYDLKLNRSSLNSSKNLTKQAGNGLCESCNINQDLKIKQLAAFVPVIDNNYDAEIELFEKKLNEVYGLCNKCNSVLRITLSVQNSWLFGQKVNYLRKLRQCGSFMKKISQPSERVRRLTLKIIQLLLLICAFMVLYSNYYFKIVCKYLTAITTEPLVLVLVLLRNISLVPFFEYFCDVERIFLFLQTNLFRERFLNNIFIAALDPFYISIIGVCLQLITSALDRINNQKNKKTNFIWSCLCISSYNSQHQDFLAFFRVLQFQLSVFVIYSIIFAQRTPPKLKVKRLRRSYLLDDSSCEEDLDNQLSSTVNLNEGSYAATNSEKSSDKYHVTNYLELARNVLNKLNFKCQEEAEAATSASKDFDLQRIAQKPKPLLSPPRLVTSRFNEECKNKFKCHNNSNSLSGNSDNSFSSELQRCFPSPNPSEGCDGCNRCKSRSDILSPQPRVPVPVPGPGPSRNGFSFTNYRVGTKNSNCNISNNFYRPQSRSFSRDLGYLSSNGTFFPLDKCNSGLNNYVAPKHGDNKNKVIYNQLNMNNMSPLSIPLSRNEETISKLFNMNALNKSRCADDRDYENLSCRYDSLKL